jgi:hypothetical protein
LRRPAEIPIVARERFGIELRTPESFDISVFVGP